jgi:hypothetical protein
MAKIVTDQIQRREGSEFTLPLKDGAAGTALVTDGKGNLYFPGTSVAGVATNTSTIAPGQAFYGFGNGTYAWTCPPGVTKVCVVAIGGGASTQGSTWSSYGGAGGGLAWVNDIPVTPGQNYTVVVGKGGDASASDTTGGNSYFIDTATCWAQGGQGASGGSYTVTSSYGTSGGGSGGSSGQYGGGGAGGYTGAGGTQNTAGTGGAASGGGGYSSTYGGASGGGTGPFGQGASGVSTSSGQSGKGGSGGEDGKMGENPWYSYGQVIRPGGLYGGGGGGTGTTQWGGYGINPGGRGCVRIIWGTGRSFPSTGTGDM